ncbi:hypothetical protein [Hymenobacter weizhouensis]|uniref:hypothetical protein n=1 Tax=Hymenobacter sp. YIM 151500-1 TaxID=2987689 RepID=UPI002227562F|nr:hypothetical protein [Hymenobacter sp. YIM 151500-1]UYZ62134.1 hypothetical protein OIS53_14100 [Hymenobacter sp. YIM 151500-1]
MVRLFLFLLVVLSSCAYDKAEDITPAPKDCGTPAVVSYAQSVSPLLDRNCRSCHDAVQQTAGVNLDDFTVLKRYVDNGIFLGNIKHLPGYKPMPKGAAKLSDCDIALLQKWVDAGAPKN